MKKIGLLLFVFVFGFMMTAHAEDLGALAKKEKARREAIEKQGKKAKTLTNADVANIKSKLAYENGASDDAAPTAPSDETAADATDQQSPASAELAAQDQKLRDLQSEREHLQQQIDQAKQAVAQGGVFHSANVGSQYQAAGEAQQKMQEVDKQIDEVKKQQQEMKQRAEDEKQEQAQQQQPPPDQQQEQEEQEQPQ